MYMKLSNLTIGVIFFSLVSACSESDSTETTTLNVEPGSLTFSYEGGTASLTVTSNTDWSISASNEDIKLTPSSGSGNKTVQVTVPRRELTEQIESKLVIKSSDGAVIRNVSIIQEGLLISGGLLRFGNHSGSFSIDGKAQAVDSIVIVSNAPWELRGPEWIEVYNKDRWTALSTSRAMVSGNATVTDKDVSGATKLYIRTAQKNDSETNRQDVLTLSQPYSGDMKCDLIVVQLGKHMVYPCRLLYLADGVATDWKYGADVKAFYWLVTKNTLNNSDLTQDKVLSSWPSVSGEPGIISAWSGLDENSQYNIYTWVQDGQSYHWSSTVISTESSKNQAIAAIKNVNHDGNKWKWQIHPNEYCKLYTVWATDNQYGLFDAPDVYLAWLLHYYFGYSLFQPNPNSEYDEYSWAVNSPIQIISWGIGQDGTKMASVISRYRTIDHSNARWSNNDSSPFNAISAKIDMELLRKSLHRIK